MPEVSPDASLMIATSWQALGRAELGDERAAICNCTVIIVFAGFFMEANLNHIIDSMNKTEDVKRFLNAKNPGMQGKLAWFYNECVARKKATNKKKLNRRLRRKFPGFAEICQFRNKVSHGIIDRSSANLKDARRLRQNAKDIVAELFKIAKGAGHNIPRGITYQVAISSTDLPSDEE